MHSRRPDVFRAYESRESLDIYNANCTADIWEFCRSYVWRFAHRYWGARSLVRFRICEWIFYLLLNFVNYANYFLPRTIDSNRPPVHMIGTGANGETWWRIDVWLLKVLVDLKGGVWRNGRCYWWWCFRWCWWSVWFRLMLSKAPFDRWFKGERWIQLINV